MGIYKCPQCGGDGFDYETDCCGEMYENGGFCSGGCAIQVKVQCRYCGGQGEIDDGEKK